MKSKSYKALQNQRGQGLIEYLIIVALIGVATIGVMRVVGKNVAIQFTNISRSISGEGGKLKGEDVDSDLYSKKDLSDFMSGANSEDDDKK